jgi:uroporphyrinogen III methyltransferase/synthase
MTPNTRRNRGTVFLVGAGPGDPGLITLRGVECLRKADLVFYDYLTNPQLLDHVSKNAECVCLDQTWRQETDQTELLRRMVDAARQGKQVVRLKAGDPHVFGRGAEESEALAAAGIPCEVVPGVTAALAAAAYAGVPLTHSEVASALALVTGQESRNRSGPGPGFDYGALAAFPGTLAFYMGLAATADWAAALLARGKPADTPVAVVRRCSWSDQSVVRCTLGTVADEVQQRQIRPPAVVLVGEAVGRSPATGWFAARPLFGKRLVVTRPRHQAASLARLLEELGGQVLFQPAIDIGPPPDWTAVDHVLGRLDRFDWLVFSSTNGVSFLLDRLWETAGDLRRLGRIRLAAIGPGTADELARYRLRADRVPAEFRAESLAAELVGDAPGRRFLLARASRGREILAETLRAAGAEVEQVVVYRSEDVALPDPAVAEALEAGSIDWVTVTSSAIAKSLARLFGERLRRARLASMSPVTSQTLRELGFEPATEAGVYTIEGLAEAIAAAG